MQQTYTEGMSLDELIGQVLCVGFPDPSPTPEILDLIQKQHIGNVIFFARNIQSPEQVSQLTHALQQAAHDGGQRHPLFIAVDQENGMVQRLGQGVPAFPGNMALGAIDDEELVYQVALATGQNLRALGINVNYAPDVDVNNNPANPVIGVRSFGEDPQRVATFGAAAVRGYREAGVVSTLKHFPGHGDTAVDSHLSLPVISHNVERLETLELIPFRRGIEAGADSVMIAHLYLPGLMQQAMVPSTVAPEVITQLLRERLGFNGIIVTDCMEMKAVSETLGTERAAVMALQAGVDQVLISHTYARQVGSIQVIKDAVEQGTLSIERLRQSAERVLSLKARLLSWETLGQPLDPTVIAAHRQLGVSAYERSTTLVRNDAGLLPLHLEADQRLLLVLPQPATHNLAVERFLPGEVFEEVLKQRHALVDVVTVPGKPNSEAYERLDQAVRKADVILVVTVNAHLDHQQAEIVKHIVRFGSPVVGIAAYNPYDVLSYQELSTYLVTYECTPGAMEAAARVVFGEVQAQGRLPVSLPGLYNIGQRVQ